MLIVVSGEDTYRALERARDLERAYREKYDAEGRSVERLPSGTEGIERLLAATAGGSLFSSRRFIRIDGLVSSCPKAKREGILKSLARDVEMTIILVLEEGTPTVKELKGFSDLPKFFHYDHPLLAPGPFAKWAREYAASAGLSDTKAVSSLIERTNGDSWSFVTECAKLRAGGTLDVDRVKEPTVYDVLDAFLVKSPRRHSLLKSYDDDAGAVAQLPNQVRSLALVSAGRRDGIHPFVAQKLSRMRVDDPASTYARLATAFVWSRTGYASPGEALDILG
jgi:hypothetical protein